MLETPMMLGAILLSSLVGSLHCAAMCGPLVGLAGSGARFALVYSLGRLVTYATFGIAAGAIGRAIDLAGRLGTVQHAASIIAAIAIIAWGIRGLVAGIDPKTSGTTFQRGLVQIKRARPTRRAVFAGMLTGLLPCGWLWAFVVVAGGTGDPLAGGATMFAFWLGTVPMIVGLFAFAGPLLAKLRARVPKITAAALVAFGLVTLGMRWRDAGADQVYRPHCHMCKS